jgi:hypothetical protein
MKTTVLMVVAVMGVLFGSPHVSMALKLDPPGCGKKVEKGHKMYLGSPFNADLDCTSAPGKAIGVTLNGGILDCAGHTIFGPSNTSSPPVRTAPPPADPGTRGVLILAPGSKVQNCIIHGWGWGISVEAKKATITNTITEYNTNYGASQNKTAAIGAKWDGLTTQYNGDEGLHLANQYDWLTNICLAKTLSTKISDSSASNNGREGWYLLRTCNVKLGLVGHGNVATNNGLYESSAGVYIKNSPSSHCFSTGECTFVQKLAVTGNHIHIIGDSDGNKFEDVTITNGFVRFQSQNANQLPDPVGWTWPNNNQLTNVCVENANYSARQTGYIFTGVTNGGNLIKGGEVRMAATSNKVASAGDDANSLPAHSTNYSTSNSIGDTMAVYMSPAFTTPCQTDPNNSFTICSTKTTGAPTCY